MTIQQLMKQIKRDNAELKVLIETPIKPKTLINVMDIPTYIGSYEGTDYDKLTAEEQLNLENLNEQNR